MQLKDKLGFGIIRKKNNNIVEYSIISIDAVEKLLILLRPYIVVKQNILLKTLEIIIKKRKILNAQDFLFLCQLVDETDAHTYGKNSTITVEYVKLKIKNNFPVETLQK